MEQIKSAEQLLREASAKLTAVERQNLKEPLILNNCQQGIELYVKAIFIILNLDFHLSHEELSSYTKQQIQDRFKTEVQRLNSLQLPKLFPYRDQISRIVFIAFFWSSFRQYAESGFQGLNIPSNFIFGREEARLAIEHARFCQKVANSLVDLKK